MTWMQTRSGRKFDLENIEDNMIDASDIAWSLAHICRFNGHCRRFYSVAEHTILMMRMPQLLGRVFDPRTQYVLTGQILVHDAHEAFVGDMPRPMKKLLGSAWSDVEDRIATHVRKSLGVHGPEFDDWGNVKFFDSCMLAAEARELMSWPPFDWELPPEAAESRLVISSPVGGPEALAQTWLSTYREWRKGLEQFRSAG